ncbi:MAG: MASE4 domain-containing protein [Usitatibacter sp.]
MRDLVVPGSGEFISTLRPAATQHRLAVAAVAISVAIFAIVAPFAKVPLAPLAAFIPSYQSALVVGDLITAAMLFGQFGILRSRGLAILGAGYVFTALVTTAHALTFPGLFSPTGLLGAGPQTTAWLYMLWHAGFPAFVIAYALTDPARLSPRVGATVVTAIAGAAVLGLAAVLAATEGATFAPPIMAGHRYTPTMIVVVTAVWAVAVAACIALWRRRPQSVLDLWLIVAMCAWTLDVALSAVLNAGRFDVGFYAGRAFGLLAAMFVLVVLLVEHGVLYARLARAHAAERHRTEQLNALNASLEERVVARTVELDDARQRLAGIIDSAMDAVITVDGSQSIVLFNRAAERTFGIPRDEALGMPLGELIPERLRAGHRAHVERFGAVGEGARRMGGLRVVTGLRRDGEEFPLDASISHLHLHGRHFYTVIVRDVTERVRAEEALQRSRQELHHIATASATAREQEKGRLARELHDELGQALTALKLDVDFLGRGPAGADPASAAKLAAMRAIVDQTVTAARRISSDLRPMLLDDLGVVAAAQWLAEGFERRYGIACELDIEPPQLELGDPHATSVYRILQEALTNVARHAQASRVQVSLRRSAGEVHLRVRDDGRGFDPAQAMRPNAFGLVGLRERAYLVDGRIRIDSAPGQGTTIEVAIPLAAVPTSTSPA